MSFLNSNHYLSNNNFAQYTLDNLILCEYISTVLQVACSAFLQAISVRSVRIRTRTQALLHITQLLTAASKVGGVTHLLAAVTCVLKQGSRCLIVIADN